MAWIQEISQNAATGQVQEIYDKIAGKRGKLSNIMKVHSLRPDAMAAHFDLYQTVMFSASTITREEREAIAVVVSVANGCQYCTNHHAAALYHYWKDATRVQTLINSRQNLEIPKRLGAVLDYAEKLTTTPHAMAGDDVTRLHSFGLDDTDILTLNLVVSYFNFVNRIALGLGVEWTPEEAIGYQY